VTDTTVSDPRAIAKALQMDAYQLAEQLTVWANEALPSIGFETRDLRGPQTLETFDERVTVARRYLENAHEAFKAWLEDNPDYPADV